MKWIIFMGYESFPEIQIIMCFLIARMLLVTEYLEIYCFKNINGIIDNILNYMRILNIIIHYYYLH